MPSGVIVKFKFDIADFAGHVIDGVAEQLATAFGKVAKKASSRIGDLAVVAIEKSPEYESLLAGKLRGELGVVDARPVLDAVVRNIQAGVVVTSQGARRAGQNIQGGMRVEIIKGDYSEVLGVVGASFTSEGGHEVDWLRWLTLEGDRVFISDFHFYPGTQAASRTGQGLMEPTGCWRVSPEFSGVEGDNWLTRALEKIVPDIGKILVEEIQRAI